MAKTVPIRTVETFKHNKDKRKNIPTAEFQPVFKLDAQKPVAMRYPRNTDLDPQLVWRKKDELDWSDLVVHAPPLYIQEKVQPKVLIDDLLRQTRDSRAQESGQPTDLFADFNGIPKGVDKTEFYQHDQNWSNRMILGDSLQVMASLAEREGLRGQVQCIYLDPPYGIKFNSNFQWSPTSRDVKDGKAEHITREPEQVKAFRDTWRDGIHSYLTYLRDRLTVARDLLTESGSIFVQIGDENVHRVRCVLDEIFGDENCVSEVTFVKNSGQTSSLLSGNFDILLWYSKNKDCIKFRRPLVEKKAGGEFGGRYNKAFSMLPGERSLTPEERANPESVSGEWRLYTEQPCISHGYNKNTTVEFNLNGRSFHPGEKRQWKCTIEGMERLSCADRLIGLERMIYFRRFIEDFPAFAIGNNWTDTQDRFSKVYVVQTVPEVVQRCLLMTTDPGDLVLDPTCGSGTTAYVAEQWGRRWITIDTSRVALALARARIMGARYPYYVLADEVESVEWLVASKGKDIRYKSLTTNHSPLSSAPSLRQGFVYERVPHITLKSIANNAEIDAIWDKWSATLEPLREKLNTVLGTNWQEWEIPRNFKEVEVASRRLADDNQRREAAATLHTDWWQARIAREKEIDASIASKAEFEYLYDKPYEDKKKVRVAGPFTVDSFSPHRMLGVDENGELVDSGRWLVASEKQSFAQMILENLKTAGVQQAHKENRITFTSLVPWPGDLVCAEGRFLASDEWLVASGLSQATSHQPLATTEKRAAIFIGPEFDTVQRADLVAAAREAGDGGFDVLIACAFNYEAHTTEFNKLGRLPVLKARMNADLHMAEDLKNTGKGNLFVIFGEPDIEVVCGLWLGAVTT